MPQHVAVSPKDHKDLRILSERSEAMGDGMMCCITFPEEFRNLQNEYLVLFQLTPERDQYRCLVVLGFENGENLYLKDGKWDASYIPLAMDIQPFMIGTAQSEDDEPKVVIDLDSPRLGKGEGTRIFDEAGMATTYLENISKKLGYLDGGYKRSAGYVDALKKHDLLEALTIDVTQNDGTKNRLIGFHTINEDKLAKLGAAELGDLNDGGYLMPTFMMLASLSNLRNLMARKEQQSTDLMDVM